MLVVRGTLKFQVGDEVFDAHAGDLVSAPAVLEQISRKHRVSVVGPPLAMKLGLI